MASAALDINGRARGPTAMKRRSPYIIGSLVVHLALLWALGVLLPPRAPETAGPPGLVMEFASPAEPSASTPDTPVPQAPPPVEPSSPPTAEPPVQVAEAVAVEPLPPEGGMVEPSPHQLPRRRPGLAASLALDKRLPSIPSLASHSPDPHAVDSGRLIAERVKGWCRKALYRRRPPEWLLISGLAALEGTAFYAAHAAGEPVAMVLIAGISLRRGTLRYGIQRTARAFSRDTPNADDLQVSTREIDILERIWEEGPIAARDLYLSLPRGWSYGRLQEHLKKLVKRKLLERQGKGNDAQYRAAVAPSRVLSALLASRDPGDLDGEAEESALRLAQVDSRRSRPQIATTGFSQTR